MANLMGHDSGAIIDKCIAVAAADRVAVHFHLAVRISTAGREAGGSKVITGLFFQVNVSTGSGTIVNKGESEVFCITPWLH